MRSKKRTTKKERDLRKLSMGVREKTEEELEKMFAPSDRVELREEGDERLMGAEKGAERLMGAEGGVQANAESAGEEDGGQDVTKESCDMELEETDVSENVLNVSTGSAKVSIYNKSSEDDHSR